MRSNRKNKIFIIFSWDKKKIKISKDWKAQIWRKNQIEVCLIKNSLNPSKYWKIWPIVIQEKVIQNFESDTLKQL